MSYSFYLFFHDIGVPVIPFIILGFLDLVLAPCLCAIAVYRILNGKITDRILKKSFFSICIFAAVSFVIYFAFVNFIDPVVNAGVQVHYFLYCLSVPFALVWSVATAVYLDSTIIAIFFGFFVNLLSIISVVSFWENRKLRKAG